MEKLIRIVKEIFKEDGFEYDEIIEVSRVENTSSNRSVGSGLYDDAARIIVKYTSSKKAEERNIFEKEITDDFISKLLKLKADLVGKDHIFSHKIEDGRLIQYLLERI